MKEKLTLSIDKQTKQRAKRYARSTGRSISEMVQDFLEALVKKDSSGFEPEPGSVVAELAGSLPIDDERPYKEILIEELSKKYRADESSD